MKVNRIAEVFNLPKNKLIYSFQRKQSTDKDKKRLVQYHLCEEWSTLQAIAKFDFCVLHTNISQQSIENENNNHTGNKLFLNCSKLEMAVKLTLSSESEPSLLPFSLLPFSEPSFVLIFSWRSITLVRCRVFFHE